MYVSYVHGRIKLIQLDHIVKTFDTGADKVHAVSDVTLHIKSGEIFGIIGFSGAGKSTLVRCINLLERPTSGTVTVDGKVLTDLPAKELREARKKIGMIFQHFNLMRSRTVGENVAYPLKGSGLTKQQIKAKVSEPAFRRTETESRYRESPCERPEGSPLRRGHKCPGPADHRSDLTALKTLKREAWDHHRDHHP